MAITSFYLLNMFPRMRTLLSSPNYQHSTPKPNMFPRMRTLHYHRTINTQHPDKTYSLRCALYIITEQSTPNTQAKHVPPDAHFTSSPNNQHPTPRPNMFLQMRTLHHHRTINTQHPSQTCSLRCALYIITEQSTPNTQTKHVPSDAHFTSSPNSQHSTAMTVIQ